MNQFKLLKELRFGPLFITQFLGAFNDNLLKNALIILITYKGVSVLGIAPSQMVALSGGIFILPFFLFSTTAGQLADKFEKTLIIRSVKLAEIAIMVVVILGFYLEYYTLLLFTLFLMGVHSSFFGPVKYSILPEHLKEDELVGGNALIEAGTFLSILLGTLLGGVLAGSENSAPHLLCASLFLCSLIGWAASLFIPKTKPISPNLKVDWIPLASTLEIFRFTKRNPTVFYSIIGISWFWFFGAIVLSLLPTYCKETLEGGPAIVTLFLTCFSIGIGVGSMLCEKLSGKRLELALVPFGAIGMSVFCIHLALADLSTINLLAQNYTPLSFLSQFAGIRLMTDLFLISLFSGFFIVPLYTLMQERSEETHRSRIIAGNNISNAFFMVLSAVFLIVLLQFNFSNPQIFLGLAVVNTIFAIYLLIRMPEFWIRFRIRIKELFS